MDVPTYAETLFITDAAINIFPDLDAKRDIVQNAIDLFTQIGLGTPRVAILSAVETVTSKIPSTIEAAALCKMADRGQITGGILDGPLAFDNAIDPEAARIKGIKSAVAGRAQILVVPDLEAGNMLAKNLTFLAKADAAGIVLGARVPIILTSRADSVRARMASCAVAVLYAHARRAHDRIAGGVSAMDTILVVNAGSSSVKFQVFAIDGKADLNAAGQGTDGRHRHAAAAACPAADGEAADRPDLRAGTRRRCSGRPRARGDWLRDERKARARSRSGIASSMAARNTTGRCWSTRRCSPIWNAMSRWRRCTSRTIWRRSARILARSPDLPQVACFDTAFHRGHDALADHYAIPEHFYAEGVRRYGFHGLSYEYVAEPAAGASRPRSRAGA